jgi:hypothetical protein
MLGLNISSGFNSVVTIYILVPLILVPQLLFSGVVVDFSKMHNKISNDKAVPLIGDLMASRWAYEALAVTQFKDNAYEQYFYSAESRAKNAGYYRSYAIPGLEEILRDCELLYSNNSDTFRFNNNLNVLRSEVIKISNDVGIKALPFIDSLTINLYHPRMNLPMNSFLAKASLVYRNRYNKAVDERDRIYSHLVEDLGGAENFILFKQKYHNKQLAAVVTNEKEIQHYSVHDGEMIPIKDAVFREPQLDSRRAHFYAPVKNFFGYSMDTFWYNLMLIWIFTLLLLALLYYDIIRKVLTFMETLRLNRLNKLRLNRLIKIAEQNISLRQKNK